jgi:hypothetical protein
MSASPGYLLTADEVDHYRAEGYLCLDRPLLAPGDLAQVGRSLDRLFERFASIPLGFAQDLDVGAAADGLPRIPEVNFTTVLAPSLSRSPVIRVCTQIARQLHGRRAHLVFDHAIYKSPENGAATSWH